MFRHLGAPFSLPNPVKVIKNRIIAIERDACALLAQYEKLQSLYGVIINEIERLEDVGAEVPPYLVARPVVLLKQKDDLWEKFNKKVEAAKKLRDLLPGVKLPDPCRLYSDVSPAGVPMQGAYPFRLGFSFSAPKAIARRRAPCETRPGLVDRTPCVVSYGAGSGENEWEERGIGPFLSVKSAVDYAFAHGADWLRVDDLKGTMLAVYCPEFDGNWE